MVLVLSVLVCMVLALGVVSGAAGIAIGYMSGVGGVIVVVVGVGVGGGVGGMCDVGVVVVCIGDVVSCRHHSC